MIWNNIKTNQPRRSTTFLIARKDKGDTSYRLEDGIFTTDKEGKIIYEKTSVHPSHFKDYQWAYECDVVRFLNHPNLFFKVDPISKEDKKKFKEAFEAQKNFVATITIQDSNRFSIVERGKQS